MNTASASHWTRTSGPSTIHGSRPKGPSQGGSVTERMRDQYGRVRSTSRMYGRLRAVPGDRPLETLPERRARLEAEELLRARGVEAPARLAIRHRLVPGDLAREARQLGDQPGELLDRDLLARADVDRLLAVVWLGGQRERSGRVVDVEELARRRAIAPEHDLPGRLVHLPDQVRDHMGVRRVEVVARPVEVGGEQKDRIRS